MRSKSRCVKIRPVESESFRKIGPPSYDPFAVVRLLLHAPDFYNRPHIHRTAPHASKPRGLWIDSIHRLICISLTTGVAAPPNGVANETPTKIDVAIARHLKLHAVIHGRFPSVLHVPPRRASTFRLFFFRCSPARVNSSPTVRSFGF